MNSLDIESNLGDTKMGLDISVTSSTSAKTDAIHEKKKRSASSVKEKMEKLQKKIEKYEKKIKDISVEIKGLESTLSTLREKERFGNNQKLY